MKIFNILKCRDIISKLFDFKPKLLTIRHFGFSDNFKIYIYGFYIFTISIYSVLINIVSDIITIKYSYLINRKEFYIMKVIYNYKYRLYEKVRDVQQYLNIGKSKYIIKI